MMRSSRGLHHHGEPVDGPNVGESSVDWIWETDILLDLLLPEIIAPVEQGFFKILLST